MKTIKEQLSRSYEDTAQQSHLLETLKNALSSTNKEKEELLTAKLNSFAEHKFTREREEDLEGQIRQQTAQLEAVSEHNAHLMLKVSELEAERASLSSQLSNS